MKENIFFIIAILSLIILSQFVSSETNQDSITGNMIVDPVTGKLTSQQVGMSIFIQTIIPYIQLISPKNQTYLKNESLILNYTLINGDYVWYNIDNLENTTITSSIQFNVSQGSHTLYIFSNNSNISIANSISFTVNSSRFVILFENYKGINNGASTNFIDYTYEEIQNLDNIIIENTNYGKIQFNEAINATDDLVKDNVLNLDSNTNISSNKIELNSTALPNFNKPATLLLYNLTFTNPRILKNGAVCPSAICTKESYTGNTLKFNVTGFSVYSAEETTETPISGGGGGGGVSTKEKEFTIDKEFIKIQSKIGETVQIDLKIKNPTDSIFEFNISKNFKDLLYIAEESFILKPGEEKNISLIFFSTEKTPAGVYTGEIIIKGNSIIKSIPVIFEVESKKVLFDVSVNVPPRYKNLFAGEELLIQLTVFNMGDTARADVFITFIIKDFKGKTILMKEEMVAVETQASLSRSLKLPKDIAPGSYVIIAETTYNGAVGTSSDTFHVKEKLYKNKLFIISFIIILLTIIVIVVYEKRKVKKIGSYEKKLKKDIREIKGMKKSVIKIERQKSKLNIEKDALQRAYKEGHIKKESYDKGIQRLKRSLKR